MRPTVRLVARRSGLRGAALATGLTLVLVSGLAGQECRTDNPNPADLAFEQVFGEGSESFVRASWDTHWGRAVGIWSIDSDTGADTVRIWSMGAGLSEEAELALGLRDMAREHGFEGELVRFFLSEGEGPSPMVVEEFAECAPVITNMRALEREWLQESRAFRNRRFSIQARISLQVGIDGRVLDWRLLRSSTYQDVDEAAMRVARRFQFRPGQIEGIPTDVWVSLPMAVNVREEQPSP